MIQYSQYSNYPDRIIPYTNNSYIVNYNITSDLNEEGDTIYKCLYVLVDSLDKGSIVNALVRAKYTISEEFALLRQQNSKLLEYEEYNNYVEQCKTTANEVINYVLL